MERIWGNGNYRASKQATAEKESKPPVYFHDIIFKTVTPHNESIEEVEFIVVIHKKLPLWALFRCPCGCGYTITLSLQKSHRRKWILKSSDEGRPTLSPSVWQTNGCYSHFWLTDGRIYWCAGTEAVIGVDEST